jgi:glycosyltransferase involved in cell wall biosynthesis
MKVAIIVPAHNESRHIGQLIKDIRATKQQWIIVVDDGSKDNTSALAEAAGATVLRHIVNLGKGAGMKTGAEYAVANGADALIFIDGDGQHQPKEIPRFIDALRHYDIVFGYRRRTQHMPLVPRFGNWFISSFIRLLYGVQLHDSQSGYRAMRAAAYKRIRWQSTDYSVESEMIALTGKRGLRYTEFEIATIYHDKYKGTTFLDGFPILWNLFWWRFFR